MTFPLVFLTIALLGIAVYFFAAQKKAAFAGVSWEQLVSQIEEVPIQGIARIATDYLQPSKGQLSISTEELWNWIGGEEGLRRMSANADVLIALAAFAGQWNPEESAIVWERMRRDGLTLRRAARRVSSSLARGKSKSSGPFNVQEAASAYWLMRERLLKLYQTSHAARYPRLSSAL